MFKWGDPFWILCITYWYDVYFLLQVPISEFSEENLLDLGMLTHKKKNLFQLADKDGEQPVPIEVRMICVAI